VTGRFHVSSRSQPEGWSCLDRLGCLARLGPALALIRGAGGYVPASLDGTPLPELVDAAVAREPAPRAVIAITRVTRIRTWVKDGITIAQLAAIHGVDAGEIAKLLGKA
jgi:hypothetical protein